MTNWNAPGPDDSLWGTELGTYVLMNRFYGLGWTITHSHEMIIEALYKIEDLQPDRTRHRKIAGRRNFERPRSVTRDARGVKIR